MMMAARRERFAAIFHASSPDLHRNAKKSGAMNAKRWNSALFRALHRSNTHFRFIMANEITTNSGSMTQAEKDTIDEVREAIRALVVEDEMLTAMHLQLQLESLGLQTVGIAADREQALRLASDDPDVAFVDMNLRDGPTGTEIAAFLAERGVRVFFVTANPAQLGEGRSYALGVINKPWNEADIRTAVQRLQ